MTFDEIIAEAKKLISQNNIEDCLRLVASNLRENHTNGIILLQRSFAEIKQKSLHGITSPAQLANDMNNFSARLLSTINAFNQNHFKDSSLTVSSSEIDNNSLVEKLLDATKEIENLKAQIQVNNLRSNEHLIVVKMILQCEDTVLNDIDNFNCKCIIWNSLEDDEFEKEVPIRSEPGGLTITLRDIKPEYYIEVQLIRSDNSIKLKSQSFSPKETVLTFKNSN